MNRRIAWILSVLLLAFTFSNAQESKTISLNEAIDLSIKNSKQLKINSAKIEEATAAVKEATQKKLPDATVTGGYLRFASPNISLKTKTGSGGGSGGNSEPPKVNQAAYGLLNASMPIFTGGRIRYGIESSKFLEQAVKLDADHDREAIIENTIEAYIELFKAKSTIDVVKRSLDESKARVTQFTNLEKNGLLARNDLLKAELQSSNIELSLLDAENNWRLANISMDLLLGLPETTELTADSSLLNQSFNEKTLDEYVQSAYANRKDAAALDLRKKAAESGVKATKGEMYPSLALTGGYVAADIPKFLSITNAVDIGLGVSYNIGSLWKTKARVQQAQARVKQLDISESLMEDNIRLDVSKNYLAWTSSRKKIDVYAKAVEQADENFRIVKNKFNNSLATTTEVLDAEVADLEAKLNYVFSRGEAAVRYTKMLQSAGLLEKEIKK